MTNSEVLTTRLVLYEDDDVRPQLMGFQAILFGRVTSLPAALQQVKEAIDGTHDNFFGYDKERHNYISNVYYFFKLKQKHWCKTNAPINPNGKQYNIEYDLHVKSMLDLIVDHLSEYMDFWGIDRKSIIE